MSERTVFKTPKRLLERVIELDNSPVAIALCPDFELGEWRHKAVIEHLFDWLPEAALTPTERELLRDEPNKLLSRAAIRVFKNTDPEKRGEVGEILLHAICRQEFGTLPLIPRLFYKMRSNDSITSVDVVHLTVDPHTKKIGLWMGEAKLFDNVKRAMYSAYDSLKAFWDPEFLKEAKALIGPKIDSNAPYAETLAWLFEEETSLDEIVDRITIPICLAADFDPTKITSRRTEEYLSEVQSELESIREYYSDRIPADIHFVCIFVPLDCKEKMSSRMLKKLESYQ